MPHALADLPQCRLLVPKPPSANNLFTNAETGRSYGRHKSVNYREWLRTAGWAVKMQAPPYFVHPGLRVLIEIDVPRQRDLDNCIKALLDLMVYVHVFADDSLVDDLHIIRRGEKQQAAVSIWPR
jgi:Holliday junction resolvase RusA-like endonuclease